MPYFTWFLLGIYFSFFSTITLYMCFRGFFVVFLFSGAEIRDDFSFKLVLSSFLVGFIF